ncbi:MAG: S8/S53 family peptidase [Calditrichaceae bacterium]
MFRFNLIGLMLGLVSFITSQLVAQNESQSDLIFKLNTNIESGKITYKLTEAFEIIDLLGNPDSENKFQDGGMLLQQLSYPGVEVILGKFKGDIEAPFTLLGIKIENQIVDIGRDSKIILRSNHDLSKLDDFEGFQNVSLKNVNLQNEIKLIQRMSYDNLTEWPSKENMPPDFDPINLLEVHKTPGLGIKILHSGGINGKGVNIAIIDQPLLLRHEEYFPQIIRYDSTGLSGYSPKMHASAVTSIAVGKHIGVAPEAFLSYFAVPMWQNENSHYINALEKIFKLNETLSDNEKIKVVSISDGRFSSNPDYTSWQKILTKAEEMDIFVVTCDPKFLDYGTLKIAEGENPDNINNYTRGNYSSDTNIILIPAGNRTLACQRGINVYTFDRKGGMSWAAPYIAGLAALAIQVNPRITPAEMKELLINTVTKTSAGPIINPIGFIESVKKSN